MDLDRTGRHGGVTVREPEMLGVTVDHRFAAAYPAAAERHARLVAEAESGRLAVDARLGNDRGSTGAPTLRRLGALRVALGGPLRGRGAAIPDAAPAPLPSAGA